jgi:hypothetical protein
LFSVFVRYRQVSQEDGWKDVEVKQSKMSFSSFATVQHLYNALIEKWQLRGANDERLILRIYDKEFDEYLDLEEDFSLISLENLAKYELIRLTNTENAKNGEPKNNNFLFECKNEVKLNEEFAHTSVQNLDLPATDLTNIIKNLQENSAVSLAACLRLITPLFSIHSTMIISMAKILWTCLSETRPFFCEPIKLSWQKRKQPTLSSQFMPFIRF